MTKRRIRLKDCPIGLFWCGDTLGLKTEYGNNEGRIDAYIVSSGEFFWGDAPQTIESQRATLVMPIDTDLAEHVLAAPMPAPRTDEAMTSTTAIIEKLELHASAIESGGTCDWQMADDAGVMREAAARMREMEAALERIANDWGHCETCGTPGKGCTVCYCKWPVWAPDDVHELARAALASGGDVS